MGAEKKLNHCQETMKQINDSWQDFGDDEETVSLCDFVMSSDSNEYWNQDDDFNKQDHHHHHHHHHNDHQDFFEFFRPDSHAAEDSSSYPENNSIIFCGKLISYKEKQPDVEVKSQRLKSSVKLENEKKKCLFPWKMSHSFNKSRIPSSSPAAAAGGGKESKGKSFNKSLSLPAFRSQKNSGKFIGAGSKKLGGEKLDSSVKKVSVSATPVKPRWYLYAFGVGRFPMEIELKDMKMRQSRKSKAIKVRPPPGDGGEPENVKRDKGRRRSAKGLWRLLKGFGVEQQQYA